MCISPKPKTVRLEPRLGLFFQIILLCPEMHKNRIHLPNYPIVSCLGLNICPKPLVPHLAQDPNKLLSLKGICK